MEPGRDNYLVGFFMSALGISTCWNSHRHQDGGEMLRELAGFGFDRVELGHGIRFSLWPEMIRELEKKEIQVTSLHNFCPLPVGFTKANPNCYEFSDPSKRRRDRAGKLTRETISHAADLGASAVVLHLGSTGQKPVTGPWNLYWTGENWAPENLSN
jgi:sugar phosphate isomerase/epimerase